MNSEEVVVGRRGVDEELGGVHVGAEDVRVSLPQHLRHQAQQLLRVKLNRVVEGDGAGAVLVLCAVVVVRVVDFAVARARLFFLDEGGAVGADALPVPSQVFLAKFNLHDDLLSFFLGEAANASRLMIKKLQLDVALLILIQHQMQIVDHLL